MLSTRGLVTAVAAYLLWGVFPIYWKALRHVDPMQVLAHRIFWSSLFLLTLVAVRRELKELVRVVRAGEAVFPLGLTAALISCNWYLYIWAVSRGFVLETSLGYFINPLVSVALGTVFLGERLRPLQKVAVSLATVAVVVLVVGLGRLPWIALLLAFSFALYGLFKKRGTAGALTGVTVETTIFAVPCLAFLLFRESEGTGAFITAGLPTTALLVGGGLATSIPLLLFGAAARLLPLSILGFCQYLAPTVQFLLAVFLYREAFTTTHAIAFGLIWTGIALFLVDGYRAWRRR